MLGGSVVNRPLAFLRDAILISSCKPADGLVPFVNAELALDEPRRGVILHYFGRRLSFDHCAKFHSEMHRVGIVDRHTPAHDLTRAARPVFSWMALFDVPGLIHCRHHEKIAVRPGFAGNSARIGIDDAKLERPRIDFTVVPVGCLCCPMQPFQMVLIHGIFDHLKEIAVDRARSTRARAVLSDQHIVVWQQRHWFGPHVNEDHATRLLSSVCCLAHFFFERALGRLTRGLDNFYLNILLPHMMPTPTPIYLEKTVINKYAGENVALVITP